MTETVRYYDGDSHKIVDIPSSELAPGAIQVRIEGIDEVVWTLPEKLKKGQLRHASFPEEVRDVIRRIQSTFAEHNNLTLEQWETDFRRDSNPIREIALWSHAADIYSEFADDNSSAEERQDIYRCIASCMIASPDTVWHVYKPETLSLSDAERITNQFYGKKS